MDSRFSGLHCDVCIQCVVLLMSGWIQTHSPKVAASVILTTWRTRLRRQMNDRDVVSVLTPLVVRYYYTLTIDSRS